MDSEETGLGTVRPLHASDEAQERLLWRQFQDTTTPEVFYSSWLGIQCRAIPKVEAGLLLTRSLRTDKFEPAAHWPEDRRIGAHVRAAAEQVLQKKRALALELDPQGDGAQRGPRTVIARPVEVAGEIEAVVVLDVEPRTESELQDALRQLAWGCGWIELRTGGGRSGEGVSALLEIVSVPLEHERFIGSATAFVTELATRFGCERVSLGSFDRGHAKLLALSHSAQFDKRANVTRMIEAAMEEAVDQAAEVIWPRRSATSTQLTQAHEALAEASGGRPVCSFPITRGSELCGAVTLERNGSEPFAESELELIDAAVSFAGPILELQRREDRALPIKARDAARLTAAHLVGPRHVALKLFAGALVFIAAFLVLAKGDFRVTADLALEARVLRAAVAPFDGYILEAPVRAGDRVSEGDVLALLDDRDLALETTRFAGQLHQMENQQREALGQRDAAQVRILSARIDQMRAQYDLATSQLARTRIVAPFDGIVVTGDLSQQLGSPVGRGDVLFEVAPLDEYRPALQVDERDIDEVDVGQTGQLVFAAFPDEPIGFSVEKITPVSMASEGRNTFRVEAHLDETPERLSPGMKGVAKIDVDRRRLIWIWTHDAIDWLRLTLWNWLP